MDVFRGKHEYRFRKHLFFEYSVVFRLVEDVRVQEHFLFQFFPGLSLQLAS